MIKVQINGEEQELKENSNITEMLEQINFNGKMFAVEKNLEIIQKEDYEQSMINDGDKIEIVVFAGGG